MCLLAQNMEPNIFSNGGEIISNYIMCGCVSSPMSITKYVYPCWIYGLVAYALKKTMSHGMGEAQFGT